MAEPLTIAIAALHAHGFEVSVRVQSTSLDALDALVADLLARGYRPSQHREQWAKTAEGVPLCPKHRIPMRLRQKQGDEWWSHQVLDTHTGEQVFCRGYPGPSSPGWEVSL